MLAIALFHEPKSKRIQPIGERLRFVGPSNGKDVEPCSFRRKDEVAKLVKMDVKCSQVTPKMRPPPMIYKILGGGTFTLELQTTDSS